jgi:hypothetical protein
MRILRGGEREGGGCGGDGGSLVWLCSTPLSVHPAARPGSRLHDAPDFSRF